LTGGRLPRDVAGKPVSASHAKTSGAAWPAPETLGKGARMAADQDGDGRDDADSAGTPDRHVAERAHAAGSVFTMTQRYWNIDEGLQLLVETRTETAADWHTLNRLGKWQDGTEDAISHVFGGEPGALEIQESEARALAAAMGAAVGLMMGVPVEMLS
jgi:hypothetical protein